MRTVFVNPSSSRGRRRNPSRRRFRRRNPHMPKLNTVVKDTALILAGAAGGAGLNRVGLSLVTNFYVRNGLRVGTAAVLAAVGASMDNNAMAAAAAGAVLAPLVPEVELQLASVTTTKNPHELAGELAAMLEADLTDEMSGGSLQDELDEIRW